MDLVNGARSSNIFWVVGRSATLGTYSILRGNVLTLASITVTTGVTVDGRTLAGNAAVTLDTDTITRPGTGVPGRRHHHHHHHHQPDLLGQPDAG